jgi:succinoglycan biosynthesis transport protein ExoP
LLARVGLQELLKKALRQFDRVVVDSAPIFGVSDTLRLVKEVDAVCLVVLAGKTPRKLATRCLQLLSRAGAPVAGVILNAVRSSLRSSYDNPYYDYGYAVEPRKRRPRVLLKAAKPDLRPNHDLAES